MCLVIKNPTSTAPSTSTLYSVFIFFFIKALPMDIFCQYNVKDNKFQ